MSIELLDYQVKPSADLLDCLKQSRPALLVAPCRTGKTFAIAKAIGDAQAKGYLPSESKKMVSVFWITKKTIKIQTTRVLKKAGVKNFFVESHSAMIRGFGELWIDWVSRLNPHTGDMDVIPIWKEEEKPDLIVVDEAQWVKNPTAISSKLVRAAIEQKIMILFASATPFTKIAEAQVVSCGCKLTNFHNWPTFANWICGPRTSPDEYNAAAMERLNNFMISQNCLVKFENIKYKHRTINHCVLIDFDTPEDRAIYNKAAEDYWEILRKANRETPEGIAKVWVAQLKFRQSGELLKKRWLAKRAIELIREGKQVIIASNFVETLRAVWSVAVKELLLKPEQIGFIVGQQKEAERQKMIDDFQKGKRALILATLKAGGVGISLHHEFKEARPRHILLPPTWSAIELVQMLGRGHGPTSLSTTHQDVVWFKDTVEEEVSEKVALKLSSLKEIVTKKESWVDLFNSRVEKDPEIDIEISKLLIADTIEKDGEGEEIQYAIEGLLD